MSTSRIHLTRITASSRKGKITSADVGIIEDLRKRGYTLVHIANVFNVSAQAVHYWCEKLALQSPNPQYFQRGAVPNRWKNK